MFNLVTLKYYVGALNPPRYTVYNIELQRRRETHGARDQFNALSHYALWN